MRTVTYNGPRWGLGGVQDGLATKALGRRNARVRSSSSVTVTLSRSEPGPPLQDHNQRQRRLWKVWEWAAEQVINHSNLVCFLSSR